MFCPKCGGQNPDNSRFCSYCGNEIKADAAQPQYSAPQQPQSSEPAQPQTQYTYRTPPAKVVKENMPLGILGALIGGVLGGLSIVLFFQMDMVASVSGLILAFCTLKGYELLGKKLSNAGIVICVVIMLIMPFLAYLVYIAMCLAKEFDIAFLDSFQLVVDLISSGAVTFGDIVGDIGLLYLFVAIGGVGTTIAAIKANK